MAEDPFLPFMEEVTEIGDELKEAYAEVDDLKASGNLTRRSCPYGPSVPSVPSLPSWVLDNILSLLKPPRVARVVSNWYHLRFMVGEKQPPLIAQRSVANVIADGRRWFRKCWKMPLSLVATPASLPSEEGQHPLIVILKSFVPLASLISEEGKYPLTGRQRVPAVILLSFIYLYLIGCIDRGGSKAGSSGSLDFRDIYISILLFRAAYVWIKFRDVIPRGAVYRRPGSSKWEPRIKFPVTRGMGVKSKRVPLGLYDTKDEGEVAYQIAAFYCDKPKHTGRLDLGGGAYFPIPTLSVDPDLPFEEKVKQVGVQVLKVYAEFEEQKASRNLSPSIPGLTLEMSIVEGQLLPTSPIQQLQQPVNSRMDSSMQCHGSQLVPNTHNGVNFNNPGSLLVMHAETQHELLDAYKQQERLKAQVSRMEIENMGWEVKCSELERKYLELEQRNLELERENGKLNHQIMQMQSQLQTQHQEQEFDTNVLFSMGNAESLAR